MLHFLLCFSEHLRRSHVTNFAPVILFILSNIWVIAYSHAVTSASSASSAAADLLVNFLSGLDDQIDILSLLLPYPLLFLPRPPILRLLLPPLLLPHPLSLPVPLRLQRRPPLIFGGLVGNQGSLGFAQEITLE